MYTQQSANVLWNGKTSKDFTIGNGVKQGGVLSPRLFCIYIDGLFKLLRRKKTGCWLNKEFVGILGYADDLILLAPSRDALQEMITNCGKFAKELNLTFIKDKMYGVFAEKENLKMYRAERKRPTMGESCKTPGE